MNFSCRRRESEKPVNVVTCFNTRYIVYIVTLSVKCLSGRRLSWSSSVLFIYAGRSFYAHYNKDGLSDKFARMALSQIGIRWRWKIYLATPSWNFVFREVQCRNLWPLHWWSWSTRQSSFSLSTTFTWSHTLCFFSLGLPKCSWLRFGTPSWFARVEPLRDHISVS